MITKLTIAAVTLGATMFGSNVVYAQQAPPAVPDVVSPPTADQPQAVPPAPDTAVDPATMPAMPPLPSADPNAPPAMPGTDPNAPAIPGTMPQMPPGMNQQPPGMTGTLPAMPGMFGSAATVTQTQPASAIPTPPPLGNITMQAGEEASITTTGTTASAPSQLYTFLFIDDPEFGVVRQKFESGVAEGLKEAEILRLMEARRNNQQGGNAGVGILGVTPGFDPGMGGGFAPGMGADPAMMGGDPMLMGGAMGGVPNGGLNSASAVRAAAEWDFYYDQLEMYDRYIRERLIPDAENLPVLEYTATNALQERQDLFESFQEEAIEQSNAAYNENLMFYERLQRREDRRRDYTEWLLLKERQVEDWLEVWARRINATRWADGEEVRVDDWYYGTDFNSADPVLVQIDDREYIISRQPARNLEDGQLNVVSSNMTPYDIIDYNGYLKNPVMETLRGTVVIPPAGPVYTSYGTEGTTGTIEIVGGVTTE